MPRMLIIAVVVGLIAGLLVGGFHNLFTVPVMERAIVLEEERAAAESPAAGAEEPPLVSLGVQRIGMAVGTGIYGAILGLIFAGGYALLRRVVPQWQPLAVSVTVAALGFWCLSLFPFIKFPLNPPGVGDENTLLFRQLFQTLFFVLSTAGVAGLLVAAHRINRMTSDRTSRLQLYAGALLAYIVFAFVIIIAIPGNPDLVPVPIDLLELFRTLTMIGHFLQWALLAVGVTLTLKWYARSAQGSRLSAAGGPESAD